MKTLILLLLVNVYSQAADINASASRTSGVAPLYIFFNADINRSGPTERGFHNLEYSWDFGDPECGEWGTTGTSKNRDKGPVTAHVYETAGSYTAVLTVRNASGSMDTLQFAVTVEDPDVIFSGTKTTCICDEANNDFTGCPDGANQVATDDLASVLPQHTEAGERVLLYRNSSWTVNSEISFPDNDGPVTIGAYGTCSSSDNLGICENAPQITMTSGDYFLSLDGKHDWRLMDLAFIADKSRHSVVSGVGEFTDILILRNQSTGFNSPFGWSHWFYNDDDFIDKTAVVSSRITDFSDNGIYLGSERLAVLGNIIQNSDETHVTRVWQAYQAVYSHNIISGSSLTSGTGRHALKLHGSTPFGEPNGETFVGTFAEVGNSGLRHHSEFIVVADNIFGSSGPWPISIGPQDGGNDERVSDLIFEKNRVLADYGRQSTTPVSISVMFEGRYITIRNNVLDGTGGANDYTGIYVARRGVEWTPLANQVYNNTIYRGTSTVNECVGLVIDSTAAETVIKNNYVSFPEEPDAILLVDRSSDADKSNNVLTDAPHFTDANNSDPLLRNFSLTTSATQAIDQGASVPVLDDFLGRYRGDTCDIGAFEYIVNAIDRKDRSGINHFKAEAITLSPGIVRFSFRLPQAGAFTLRVYDIAGRLVWKKNGYRSTAERCSVYWNSGNRSSGICMVDLVCGKSGIRTGAMVIK